MRCLFLVHLKGRIRRTVKPHWYAELAVLLTLPVILSGSKVEASTSWVPSPPTGCRSWVGHRELSVENYIMTHAERKKLRLMPQVYAEKDRQAKKSCLAAPAVPPPVPNI